MLNRNPFRTAVLIVLFACALAAAPVDPHGASAAAVSSEMKAPPAEKMIEAMLAGRAANQPIAPLTQAFGPFSLDEAYGIQRQLARRLTRDLGDVIGYKVAYASEAAQKQFGVPGPASAPLFELQRVPSGTTLRTADFMTITLETEVAFTIGRRIDRRIESADALKPHVRWVHAAFDMGNNRYATSGAKPLPADQIANGVGGHFFVLGPAHDPGAIPIDDLNLKLVINGETVRESAARNVMGSPWNSLRWVANQIVERGEALEPGDIVLTGTAAPAYSATGAALAAEYLGDCGPLGQVRCTIR